MATIRMYMPAGWTDYKDFLSLAAGRAFAHHNWSIDDCQIAEPERAHEISGRFEGPSPSDPWGYDVFEDGSVYFWTNAQDEVWREGVNLAEHLVHCLLTSGPQKTFEGEDAYRIGDPDREFIKLYYDRDEIDDTLLVAALFDEE